MYSTIRAEEISPANKEKETNNKKGKGKLKRETEAVVRKAEILAHVCG